MGNVEAVDLTVGTPCALTANGAPVVRVKVVADGVDGAIVTLSHVFEMIPDFAFELVAVDARRVAVEAPSMATEDRVTQFDKPTIVEQFESLALEDFQQELECFFIDESYRFFLYDLILPCTSDDIVVVEDPTVLRTPVGRIAAGVDVGRTRDRSELAVFKQVDERFTCRMMSTFINAPFVEQEAQLRYLLTTLPVARPSVDRSGIGMNLAENLSRDFPQVVPENFTNDTRSAGPPISRFCCNDGTLRRREIANSSGRSMRSSAGCWRRKVSFDAERTNRGHADKFWAVELACQRERTVGQSKTGSIGVRVIG